MGDIEKAILVGAFVVVGAYALKRSLFPTWTPAQTQLAVERAGGTSYTTPTGSYVQTHSLTGETTTFKVSSSLTARTSPNVFQRILIGVDRIVPGTILTRWALG